MSAEDERWHVRIAPDDVKVLTLEQIDDLFRLEMIDGETLLRQEGTSDWLPLRVVAGLDEDEPAAAAAPVHSAPPPPPPPLPAPSGTPFAPSPSFAPPPVRTSTLPQPFSPPPPPKPPVPSQAPPAASFAPPPARVAPPVSAAPPPLSFTPPSAPLPPARASRAETTLIALAALLGLLVILYRNDVLPPGASAQLDAVLGGPSVGTTRAVDALVAKTPNRVSASSAR